MFASLWVSGAHHGVEDGVLSGRKMVVRVFLGAGVEISEVGLQVALEDVIAASCTQTATASVTNYLLIIIIVIIYLATLQG